VRRRQRGKIALFYSALPTRMRDENSFYFYLPLLKRQVTILGEVRKYK